ncbi:hypothetical protein SUDANB108_04579 [Streptomyces sp. enrichment culture]|uniref:hypothetical protein n=1 Tax=Streptomyces sp. enrichment culture TaxID=1795815 RepID=UPI003F5444ED
MREWRPNRTPPSPAAEAGPGGVRRVHHARRSWPVLLTGKLVFDAVTVPLLVRSLAHLTVTPGARPFIVFGWLLATWSALVHRALARRPLPSPPTRRLLPGTVAAAVAATELWALTLSPFSDVVLAHRAYDMRDFASLCAHPGASFPESAAYTSTGGHPTALFAEEHGSDPVATSTGGADGAAATAPDPDDIQLVACSRRVRRQLDMVCTYDGGDSKLTTYRARYRIDVYETRTGRRTASHTMDADDNDPCPYWLAAGGERGREEVVAAPADGEYQSLVDGIAAGRTS